MRVWGVLPSSGAPGRPESLGRLPPCTPQAQQQLQARPTDLQSTHAGAHELFCCCWAWWVQQGPCVSSALHKPWHAPCLRASCTRTPYAKHAPTCSKGLGRAASCPVLQLLPGERSEVARHCTRQAGAVGRLGGVGAQDSLAQVQNKGFMHTHRCCGTHLCCLQHPCWHGASSPLPVW